MSEEKRKVTLQEAMHSLIAKMDDMLEYGFGDDEMMDVLLGEIRRCLEYNGVRLPKTALHDLVYETEYHRGN